MLSQRLPSVRLTLHGRLRFAPDTIQCVRCRPSPRLHKPTLTCSAVQPGSTVPAFVQPDLAQQIQDPTAQALMSRLQRVPVSTPGLGPNGCLLTAVVGPSSQEEAAYPSTAPAVVMLHSFDSNCLEFRRLYPLLAQSMPTYAVDLVGWGFTDHAWLDSDDKGTVLGPEDKRQHLRAFLQQHVPKGRKVILLGASMGGAVAADYCLHYPEDVHKLVLLDPQVFIDGIGPLAKLPRFAAELGVKLLQMYWLRKSAGEASYFDKVKYATDDAVKIGRLHTFLPGWMEANLAFMRSGGYSMSKRVKQITADTLVLWGKNDGILGSKYAQQFTVELPTSRLVFIENCGHSPHLERAELVAKYVLEFAGVKDLVPEAELVPQ